jgi:transposase-like protein
VVKPRQLHLFEKPHPGDSAQVDVKVVKVNGRKAYKYTALDDCTRFRVLRLYLRLNSRTSLDFLAELRRTLPFPIQRLQCDNGTEFPLAFALSVRAAGMAHRYIKPRCPEQGAAAAKNIERAMRGRPLKPFRYRAVGLLASIGRRTGVARVGSSFPESSRGGCGGPSTS